MIKSKQRYYELGEKAGKVLAWQLKREENKKVINEIELTTGRISSNPNEINEAFKNYYKDLYTAQSTGDIATSLHVPAIVVLEFPYLIVLLLANLSNLF